jgi:trimeric autotransporter adhesin
MKKYLWLLSLLLVGPVLPAAAQIVGPGSRMKEIFERVDLASGPTRLYDPWEITYGPDGFLWITEARPYKVYRMDPSNGNKVQVLDLSLGGGFSPSSFRRTFSINQNPWPQGGLAGLAIHPHFMKSPSPKKYVYISYTRSYDSVSVTSNGGIFFTNSIVRFTYNTTTGLLDNPEVICDTLPGSNDHNSQRMIIAPVGSTYYLFYAQGDMGAGQFSNLVRANKAQDTSSYEGKILRFNLEEDGDAGMLDKWIPNDNPFNSGPVQSAVWVTGIRNSQGFAYDSVRHILYSAQHGPFSDDEINIIERAKNYGHPRVIGYSWDHNYDSAKAGPSNSKLPFITDEYKYAHDTIGTAGYGEPIYSFYPAAKGNTITPSSSPLWSVQYIYSNQTYPGPPSSGSAQNLNNFWYSEGISGLGLYNNSTIPGWKNSLLATALKGGKIQRLKLSSDGMSVIKTAPYDTVACFRSPNRFRDVAISPDGRTIFTIIDSSQTTSGPTTSNPIISACRGCVQKFTFLGYAHNGTTSTIPSHIPVAMGKAGICENANAVVINSAHNNTNLWVPITDTNSHVVAEINANGNNLDSVFTTIYINGGAVREFMPNHTLYMDRNLTITPQVQPSTAVSIRLYVRDAELTALKNAFNSLSQPSGIASIGDIVIVKNADPCGPEVMGRTSLVATTDYTQAGDYALQGNITSFSTFYFAKSGAVLPLYLLSFKGNINKYAASLQWITQDEHDTKRFIIQRSSNGRDFDSVGTVMAKNTSTRSNYSFTDADLYLFAGSTVYYRLRIIDADGQYSYSPVVPLSLSGTKGIITIRPNPVVTDAVIDITAPASENAGWQLIDNTGNVVMYNNVLLKKGANAVHINMSTLPSGIYYLKVSGNKTNGKVKLQKL